MVTGHRAAPPIMHLKAVKDNRRRTRFLPHTLACHSGLRKLWTMSNKGYVWSSFDKINENEVQCKISRTRLAYHRSSTAMHNHLRAKRPGGPSTGQQQSVASFMIRTITARLEKLFDDNVRELRLCHQKGCSLRPD